MPNHVTNKVEFTGKNAKEACDALYENGEFDFGFYPMPEELRGYSSPVKIVSQEDYDAAVLKKKDNPNDPFNSYLPMTAEMSENFIQQFGCDNWYDWAVSNWGTKWAGYDGDRLGDESVIFMTAWSTPHKALEKLSEQFPETTINVRFSDEDFGSNVGTYELLNGEIVEEYLPEYGTESLELAYEIQGQPTHMFEWMFEHYETEEEMEDELEQNEYTRWVFDKCVEVEEVPVDAPLFGLKKLLSMTDGDENNWYVKELKKLIGEKLAQSE